MNKALAILIPVLTIFSGSPGVAAEAGGIPRNTYDAYGNWSRHDEADFGAHASSTYGAFDRDMPGGGRSESDRHAGELVSDTSHRKEGGGDIAPNAAQGFSAISGWGRPKTSLEERWERAIEGGPAGAASFEVAPQVPQTPLPVQAAPAGQSLLAPAIPGASAAPAPVLEPPKLNPGRISSVKDKADGVSIISENDDGTLSVVPGDAARPDGVTGAANPENPQLWMQLSSDPDVLKIRIGTKVARIPWRTIEKLKDDKKAAPKTHWTHKDWH